MAMYATDQAASLSRSIANVGLADAALRQVAYLGGDVSWMPRSHNQTGDVQSQMMRFELAKKWRVEADETVAFPRLWGVCEHSPTGM